MERGVAAPWGTGLSFYHHVRVRYVVVEYPTERLTLRAGRKMFAVRTANVQSRRIA